MSEPGKIIVPESRFKAPAVSEQNAMLAMIERAARDPAIDVGKMEQLFALRKQMADEVNEAAFNVAMTAAQLDMTVISKDATNSQTGSKYASYAKLDRALRPIYTKHGFALSFDEGDSPKAEHVRILCRVSHAQGFSREYHTDMPADGKGAKGGDVMTKTHAVGAAKQYGMRYLLKGIFNVAVGENEDDGNDPSDCIGPGQAADIRALLTEVNAKEDSFLRTIKAASIESIKLDAYPTVIGILEAKRKGRS
jgi:hypothetical protein